MTIDNALNVLNLKDGVIVIPTDTTYGVICRLDHPLAIDKIYELKGRDRSKPLIILGSSPSQLMEWIDGDKKIMQILAKNFWPGALTIVAKAAASVPASIMASGTTIGLRMPKHDLALSLLSQLPQGCAASTSANISGAGIPENIEEVISTLRDKVDYILSDGNLPAGNESTIVDISKSQISILRKGAIEAEQILSAINNQ